MTDHVVESCKQTGDNQPRSLHKAVETVRARFSSVTVGTSVADNDTALAVRFLGGAENLRERQLLVNSLAECLPQALSLLGISPEHKHGGGEATRHKTAS